MHNFSDLESLVPVLGSEDPNHEMRVQKLMNDLHLFHVERERTYKRSFAKRGFIGIFMNLTRKSDRLDALVQHLIVETTNRTIVTLIDTLVDISLYALKWLDAIQLVYPEAYALWKFEVYDREVKQKD